MPVVSSHKNVCRVNANHPPAIIRRTVEHNHGQVGYIFPLEARDKFGNVVGTSYEGRFYFAEGVLTPNQEIEMSAD